MRVDGVSSASARPRPRGDDRARVESRASARGRRRRVERARAMPTATTARAGRGTVRERAWVGDAMPASAGIVRPRTRGRRTRTRAVIVANDGEATEGLGDDGEAGHAVVYTFGSEGEFLRARANKPRSRVVEESFRGKRWGDCRGTRWRGCSPSYSAAYFVRRPLSVVKAPVKDALGFTTGTMGLIDSAFLLTYALGQFVMPALGDRVGAKNVIVVEAGGVLRVLLHVWTRLGAVRAHGVLGVEWISSGGVVSLARQAFEPVVARPASAGRLWGFGRRVSKSGHRGHRARRLLVGVVRMEIVDRHSGVVHALRRGTAGVYESRSSVVANDDVQGGGVAKDKEARRRRAGVQACVFHGDPSHPRLKMLMLSYFCVKIVRYCLLFWLPYFLSQEYKMSVAVAVTCRAYTISAASSVA